MKGTQTGHKRTRVKPHVERHLQAMIRAGMGQTAIYEELDREFGKDAVSIETVKRRIKYLRPPDPSGVWSLVTSDLEHVAAGLDMLAAHAEANRTGKPLTVTNALVERVALMRHGRADIPTDTAWNAAFMYIVLVAQGDDSSSIDTFLAYAPWRGFDERWRYFTAVHERRIAAAPTLVIHKACSLFMEELTDLIERRDVDQRDREAARKLFESNALEEQIPHINFIKAAIGDVQKLRAMKDREASNE